MKIAKKLQYVLMGVISVVVILILFQPDVPLVLFFSENAVWVIFILLFLSFIALILSEKKLIYFGMFSAAIITLFLKDLSNDNLMFRAKNSNVSSLHIMHYNIFNIEGSREHFIDKINKSNPDVISCEELTPDWNNFLTNKLKEKYPYIISLNRLDVDSKLVFSKYEFLKKDTFYLSGHPQLDVTIDYENVPVKMIFSYVLPYSMGGENAGNSFQLIDLYEYISNQDQESLILVGEFNQVYWSKNIRGFLYKTKLNNARRSVSINKRNPYDHIFYSNEIKCIKLDEIFDENFNHIGIEGRFKIVEL